MAEPVRAWWARRQFSRGTDVPYPVGTYREQWAAYPMLVKQYHPELNAGFALSQIPPAADVLLLWECEAGHRFAATPSEQRARPGGERRRSSWCPECAVLAKPPRVVPRVERATRADAAARPGGAHSPGAAQSPGAPADPGTAEAMATVERPAVATRPPRARPARRAKAICEKTPAVPVGEPFFSPCAPPPASAAEGRLRQALFARLAVTAGLNAVRVGRPFFGHLEVWPDILLPELRIAIEYDTVGRFGLEHVGSREEADRRKDALLRAARWEVVRVRTGRLETLGPYDLQMSSVGRKGVERIIEALRGIRGSLLIDAYLRDDGDTRG